MSTQQIQPHENNGVNPRKGQFSLPLMGLLLLGVSALVLVGGYQLWTIYSGTSTPNADEYTGTAYEPPVQIPDFTLPASTGNDLSLSDLEGNYALIFFGFTNCPDVCPTTLAIFRQVKSILGDSSRNVIFLFISVDPERDTPDVIRQYITRFDTEFIGLSGTDEVLAEIGEPFGLQYQRREDQGEAYSVEHTGRSFLLNSQGDLIRSFAYGTDAEAMATGVLQAMK
jgi:protein SCO1